MSGKETNKVHILLCYVFNEAGHVCQRIMFCTTIMDLGISFCISVFEGKQVVFGKVSLCQNIITLHMCNLLSMCQ